MSHGKRIDIRSAHCDGEFQFLMVEETSRGRRRPIRAVSLTRQRMIRRLTYMLRNPGSSKRAFLAAIREYGIGEGSVEFLQLCELWDARHG